MRIDNPIVIDKLIPMDEVKEVKQDNQYATKGDLQGLGSELKTYMGVLFERASDQTVLLAEQLQGTNHRVGGLESKVDNLESKVDNLESKVDMVIETVGEIKVTVVEIRDSLDNKVDKKDFVRLERQVAGLVAKAG